MLLEDLKIPPSLVGIPRNDMPQIESKKIPQFIKYLGDNGVAVERSKESVKKLHITQLDINKEKVYKMLDAPDEVLKNIIIVSSDNYILDGHHRFVALLNKDPSAIIPVYRVHTKIIDLIKLARDFGGVFFKNIQESDMLSFKDFNTFNLFFESCDDNFDDVFHGFVSERLVQAEPIQPYTLSNNDIEDSYKKILSLVDDVKNELGRGLKKLSGSKGKVYIDIKTLNSLKSKVVGRGKNINSITDVLRSAVTFSDQSDLDKFVKNIKKVFKIAGYDHKEIKNDKNFGYYGSHHYLVKLSNGVIAEIQAMTNKLWVYKADAHLYYEKWRDVIKDIDNWSDKMKADFEKDKAASKAMFMKGNR